MNVYVHVLFEDLIVEKRLITLTTDDDTVKQSEKTYADGW